MKIPWLSVLIPTYNGEDFLSQALDSIILQEDDCIECIIVDDGSTDATRSIVAYYESKLPIYFYSRGRQRNWVANTNFALSCARGEYVCFLHQDDIWFKNRLQIMKQKADQFPDVGFFLHDSSFLDHEGKQLGLWHCPLPSYPKIIPSKLIMERLLIQNFISIPAPVFKREIALEIGGLDEKLWYTADWEFWLKLSVASDTLYYPRPLSGFRIHPNSQTIERSTYLEEFQEQLEIVLNKHFVLWDAPEKLKKKVKKIADFSNTVNVNLAARMHEKKTEFFRLFVAFFLLGPFGWYRYFRDSRIWERVSSRLRVNLNN